MGTVAAEFRIMPESPEVDLEQVKSDISKLMKIQDSQIEPLAFGLKALKILIVVPDKEMGDVEGKIRSVKGVSEVEAGSATLL
jgi:elongation factor 1-beta